MDIRFFHHRDWGISPSIFRTTRARIGRLFPELQKKMNVIFVDDPTIHELNLRTRDRDCPTDVLSFTYPDEVLLGEIYIGVETVRRQAGEYGVSFEDELNKIFVHGFLHLKGYSHDGQKDLKIMRTAEQSILERRMN